ncbi:trypsin eta-like [Trichogramma pretiosum]|uniref:trypsin eta-like n=1 Tax=Trichogramma pretiosum TaxID=7493 RepID=UPI000C71B0E3|nr:trypsin eta-like [Trichogramma pretiosum]
MLEKSLLSSFLGLFIIIAASNAEPILEGAYAVNQAKVNKFKHHVSVQIFDSENGCTDHSCEGAILDELHIITTAFCAFAHKDKNLVVVAGALDLRDKEAGLYHEVEYTYIPKTYPYLKGRDEIGILKLKKPLPLGSDSRIEAIKLPTADHSVGQGLFMTGYGFLKQYLNRTLDFESTISPILRFDVQTEVFNLKDCDANNKDFCTIVLTMDSKATTCNAFHGAPLVEASYDSNRQIVLTLVGVFKSWIPNWCGTYNKHTKVSDYLDFISNVRNQVLNDVKSEKLPTDDYPNKLRRYPQCKL